MAIKNHESIRLRLCGGTMLLLPLQALRQCSARALWDGYTGAAEGLAELLKIDSLTKGIRVNTENKDITVDINIIVEYGVHGGGGGECDSYRQLQHKVHDRGLRWRR